MTSGARAAKTRERGPSSERAPLRLIAAERPVRAPEPVEFLRRRTEGRRGFWQCEGEWVAHAGSLVELGIAPGARVEPFAAIRDAADHLACELEGLDESPRLFGGFAFDVSASAGDAGSGSANGLWAGFPRARFVLPGWELTQRRDGAARLRLRARVSEAEDPEEELARLRARVEEEACRLEEPSLYGSGELGTTPAVVSVVEPVDRDAWSDSVRRILAHLRDGSVRKVVLARPLDVTLDDAPNPIEVAASLRRRNPNSCLFLIETEPGTAFVGAAPEMLATLRGDRFSTMVVAGSAARSRDPVEDEMLGRELLASEKNRLEHRIGVEDVVETLAGSIEDLDVDEIPRLHRLAGIQHLRTDLSGRVRPGTHALEIAAALHPTAAVSGHPRREALEILRDEEPEDRGWYAGPVGWFDLEGNGELAPALRSAVLAGADLRLYAGAGIVRGSRPGMEWEETRVKFQTVLSALGVRRAP